MIEDKPRMKNVLIVTCLNLRVNSSVNMANIAYINGFIENGYKVTIIMPDADAGDKDESIVLPDVDILMYALRNHAAAKLAQAFKPAAINQKQTWRASIKRKIYNILHFIKRAFTRKKKSIYALDYFISETLKHMDDFCSSYYDIVLSISTPVESHYLTEKLIGTKKMHYGEWIQLWEDPWFADLYEAKTQEIFDEEKRLLMQADRIIYVSPLTCDNQKQLYPDAANKMEWAFLPCYTEVIYGKGQAHANLKLGYFGEYFSFARNILPLASAVDALDDVALVICGNSDVDLSTYHNVSVCGRVDLATVNRLQRECDILVNVSNLGGGQIPGKVYQYAGTDKHILFILDGSDYEKKMLKTIFEPYNRYIFCDNTQQSIYNALAAFRDEKHIIDTIPVEDFKPRRIVKSIIDKEKNS